MCRSEAPCSTAIFRRSLTCMGGGSGDRCPVIRGWTCSSDGPLVTRHGPLFLSAASGDFFGGGAQRRLFGVDVGQPAVSVGGDAVDGVEEGMLQGSGHRTAPAGADLNLVH